MMQIMRTLSERLNIILIMIVCLAAFLRLYNANWDHGAHLHPDERAIVLATLPLKMPKSISEFLNPASSLNPHFFAYGNLPIYLLKISSNAVSIINPSFATYDKINLVGRVISALADLFTIILIYKIGKLLFDKKLGLAASFIYAFSVFPIQTSHFYAVDILLTFFITLTLYRILRFYKNPGFQNSIPLGVSFGLALSTKISALPIIVPILFALLIDFVLVFLSQPRKIENWLLHVGRLMKGIVKNGIFITIATLITFFATQPYALIDFKEFISQNLQQSQMTRSAYTFPYTLQYVGKIPYIYELSNIFLWGLGPILFSLTVAGLVLLVTRLKTFPNQKRAEIFILLTFLTVYFLIVGKFAVGWMRYMLPLYPMFAIFAGFCIQVVFLKVDTTKKIIVRSLIKTLILTLIIIWPLSFFTIYTHPNSRVAATNWINANVPSNSKITSEVWDDRLPLYSTNQYNFIDLSLYDQPDNNAKWQNLSQKIESADYIIIASNRLYTPIQKLSDCARFTTCFPIASRYYKQLFEGKLGFKETAEFSSYPTIPLLNIKVVDDHADESFTVYDHPKVFIFKKTTVVKSVPIM